MEGRYPPGLYILLSDCTDPAKEAEFNRWYNEVHLADLGGLWFVRNLRRYETVLPEGPGRGPKYLALYEFYRDDLEQALKEFDIYNLVELKAARGHSFADMSIMISALYRKIGSVFRTERSGRPARGVHVVLYNCNDPSREAGLNRWNNEKHIPDLLNTGLYHTTYRFQLVGPGDLGPRLPTYLHLYETELDPRQAFEGLAKHRPWPDGWNDVLDVLLSTTYRLIYPLPH